MGWRKYRCATANIGIWFSDAKDLGEIRTMSSPTVSSPTGALNVGGVGKIGEFRQLTRYLVNGTRDTQCFY